MKTLTIKGLLAIAVITGLAATIIAQSPAPPAPSQSLVEQAQDLLKTAQPADARPDSIATILDRYDSVATRGKKVTTGATAEQLPNATPPAVVNRGAVPQASVASVAEEEPKPGANPVFVADDPAALRSLVGQLRDLVGELRELIARLAKGK